MKIYKDFFKELLQNNMEAFFTRAATKNMRDIDIPELRTKLTNVQISLQAKGADFDLLDLDTFFDNGNILLEMLNLEFSGDGEIIDPQTGAKERVEFSGPLSVTKIAMKSGSQMRDNLSIPSLDIQDVSFEVIPNQIVVSTFGDLPLYKSHRFEDAIKSMLL